MTGYERVRVALGGRPPDRVPVGEFALPPTVATGLLGRGADRVPGGGLALWQLVEEAVRLLGLDAVGVIAGEGGPAGEGFAGEGGLAGRALWGDEGRPGGGLAGAVWLGELGYWAGRDLFVWVVVDGPWQGLARAAGWAQAMTLVSGRYAAERWQHLHAGDLEEPEVAEVEGPLLIQLDRSLAQVARALEAGADGVVLGEDVAYAGGLFLAPSVIEERLWPLWREVVRYCAGARTARGDRPLVCFHSDGKIEGLLPLIRDAGFDAVHSLEPEAGMDAARLVGRYRGQLGLWGGLSVDLLVRGTPDEIAAEAERLARAGIPGGLMLGTCSGVVPEGVPITNLLAAYRATAVAGGEVRSPPEEDRPPS
ncbi:MAG: hypothetical protein H5U04_11810 [Firmicutes bacterium]|nr:hypothetical protein [Bacillota bacterium]